MSFETMIKRNIRKNGGNVMRIKVKQEIFIDLVWFKLKGRRVNKTICNRNTFGNEFSIKYIPQFKVDRKIQIEIEIFKGWFTTEDLLIESE